jgi:hypothetical protein
MGDRPAHVRNAGDVSDVKRAERAARRARERELTVTRAVMATVEGREFLRNQLELLGVFRSIWRPSAEIHYLAGRQDAGHELMALLAEADEAAYLQMETEARERRRRADVEMDAGHTAPLEQHEGDE